MKRIIATIATILTVGIIATTASAHMSRYDRGRHMTENDDTCWSETDETSAATNKEAYEAKKKFSVETVELRKEIATKGIELETLYLAEEPDTDAIKKVRTELIDLQADLNKKAVEAGVANRGRGRHMNGTGMMGYGHMYR
ncbi:hypothetical protein ACFL6N_00585 [Thermodesulfobacteriota bacterium]